MTTTETAESTTLEKLLEERRSCRGFRPDPVPRPVIERVLELAGRSPSWCNTQPWHSVVTSGEGTERFRRALTEYAGGGPTVAPDFGFPARYTGVYQQRRRECGFQLYESVGVTRGDRVASAREARRNFELFDAPHTVIVTTPTDLGTYGAVDCGLYIGAFLLAAQSVGLGAVPQAALATYSDFVRDHFDLPEDRRVVCGISFGYPEADHPANGFRTTRAAVADTFRWVDA